MFGTFIMPPANPTEVQIVIEQWREVIGALAIRYIHQPPAQPFDHGRLFAVFHGTRTLIYAELLNQPEHVGLIPIAPRACGPYETAYGHPADRNPPVRGWHTSERSGVRSVDDGKRERPLEHPRRGC